MPRTKENITKLRADPRRVLQLVVDKGYEPTRKKLKVGKGTVYDIVLKNIDLYGKMLAEKGKSLQAGLNISDGKRAEAEMPSDTGQSHSPHLGPKSPAPAPPKLSPADSVKELAEACSPVDESAPVSSLPRNFKEALRALPYEFHEATKVFAIVDDEKFEALVANIRANGLHREIDLYEGKILGGRRRQLACLVAGKPTKYRELKDVAEPLEYIIDDQLLHSQLGKSALACCAVLALPHYEEGAKERRMAGLKQGAEAPVGLKKGQRAEAGRSAQRVADRFGMSRAMVNLAKRLHKSSPKLFLEVHNGRLSLSAALEKLRPRLGEPVAAAGAATEQVTSSPIQEILAYITTHRKPSRKSIEASQQLIGEVEEMLRNLA